jgi:hypothetical protein
MLGVLALSIAVLVAASTNLFMRKTRGGFSSQEEEVLLTLFIVVTIFFLEVVLYIKLNG